MQVRDIVGIAGFGVGVGVLFAAWSHFLAPLAFASLGHLGIALIYGGWFLGGTTVGYIIRRPWAAFLGETIGGSLTELLLLSPYSILLLYYGPAQGIMSELAFALGRYRRFGYGTMALAGALPALAAYPFDCLVSPFYPACRDPGYPLFLHLSIFGLMVLSGLMIAGLLIKFLIDKAVEAGALRGWAVAGGQEPKHP